MEEAFLAGTRVLIVEFEPLTAMNLHDIVAEAGGEAALITTTPDQALTALQSANFDFAILDISTRDKNAIEVAQRLVKKRVPFVVTISDEFTPAGFPKSILLRKPFSIAQFRGAVETTQRFMRQNEWPPMTRHIG